MQTRLGSKSCYGVDRQGDRLIIVLAQRHAGRVTFTPVNPERTAALASSSNALPAVAAIPCGRCFTRWIETPFASPGKTRRILPTLLDVQLPFPLESCQHACVTIETVAGQSRALTAAVRQTDLDAEIQALIAHGIDPAFLDCEPLALWTQSLQELPPPTPGLTRGILYLGTDSIRLAMGRDHNYLGGHAVRSDDAAQLSRFLTLYETPAAASSTASLEWWFCGPGTQETDRLTRIQSALLAACGGRAEIIPDPVSFLARAVATRALLAGPLRCNLRAGASTHPALVREEQHRARAAAALSLAAGILLCAASLFSSTLVTNRAASLDREFRTMAETLTGAPLGNLQGEQALRHVEEALRTQQKDMAPFLKQTAPSPADILPPLVAAAAEHHVQIQQFIMDSGVVSINGACSSLNDCSALADVLGRFGIPVTVKETGALPDKRIGFSITRGVPAS